MVVLKGAEPEFSGQSPPDGPGATVGAIFGRRRRATISLKGAEKGVFIKGWPGAQVWSSEHGIDCLGAHLGQAPFHERIKSSHLWSKSTCLG